MMATRNTRIHKKRIVMHKNENRPGYIRTTLGKVAEIQSGGTPLRDKPEFWNGNIPWVKTTQIRDSIISADDVDEWITEKGLKESSTKVFPAGTILMAMYGQGKTRGRVAVLGISAAVNQACAAIIFKTCVDRDFVFQQLLSKYAAIRKTSNSGGQDNLSAGIIKEFPIALPPLPEQKAIAGVLDCWDRGIRNLELKIEKKRLIKNGLMQRLLSGKQRLKGFYKEWKCVRLGEVTTPRKERIDSRQQGIQTFCVDLEHIAPETGKLLGHTSAGENASLKTVFQSGDILFGKLRAYLRKYWLADQTGVCSTEIWALPPNKMLTTSQYLFQIIKTDLFIDAANSTTGTHMPRSDWDTVKNYTFGLPPLAEQQAIAKVLSAADSEIEALVKKLALWKEQKKHLLNNLVTGTIRLPQFCIKETIKQGSYPD
jgi:type I restriction enzyme S subunit